MSFTEIDLFGVYVGVAWAAPSTDHADGAWPCSSSHGKNGRKTTKTLASAQIGLAVKKGATKPDISSVEAFRRALLNAKSVAYVDPATGATSGAYLAQAVEKLGISAELSENAARLSRHRVGPAGRRSRGVHRTRWLATARKRSPLAATISTPSPSNSTACLPRSNRPWP